jgi:hypothetical protein
MNRCAFAGSGDNSAVALQRVQPCASRNDSDVMPGSAQAKRNDAADPARANEDSFHAASLGSCPVSVYGNWR